MLATRRDRTLMASRQESVSAARTLKYVTCAFGVLSATFSRGVTGETHTLDGMVVLLSCHALRGKTMIMMGINILAVFYETSAHMRQQVGTSARQ
jgi:hypothetical protein